MLNGEVEQGCPTLDFRNDNATTTLEKIYHLVSEGVREPPIWDLASSGEISLLDKPKSRYISMTRCRSLNGTQIELQGINR